MGILGSISNFLFGGKQKTAKQTEHGTTDFDPYSPTIPYLDDYLKSVSGTFNGGAPQISPYEQSGYDALKSTVGAGSTALDPAIAENNKTLSGSYLDPNSNPYIADMARRAAGMAGSQASSTFSGAGRTGSGLAGYYAGKGAAEAANDLFGQNYEAERGRMSSAVGMAPTLESGRYLGPQALISAGQNISARPFDIASQYGNILSTIAQLGQQGTSDGTTTKYGYSPGLIGGIVNSFTNKLFPGVQPWPGGMSSPVG